jgi:hypothetical protein
VLEAISWRLASELVRRHPHTLRLIRAHPGGGQYDCLSLSALNDAPGSIQLNRSGTIQVHERFDGRESDWPPTEWDEYIRANPRGFLNRLEVAAGLPSPTSVPASTLRTLTYRVLAAIASTAIKSVDPIAITQGYIDTSGYGGGPNHEAFDAFGAIPNELRTRQAGDLLDQPGYRFWFVVRNDVHVLAFEQEQGLAWTTHHTAPWNLMELYQESRRNLLVTSLKLWRRVDQI